MPTKPAPFARQLLTEDMLTNRTPEAHAWAVEQFKTFRSEGQFVPLSIGKDTVVFPGFDGGAEWGGSAADPQGILYVNSNDIAWTGALAENMSANSSPTRALYLSQCAACHEDNLQGQPPDFPSLIGVGSRLTADQITTTIRTGKGRMPAFSGLTDDQVSSLVEFLMTGGGRAGRGRGRGGAARGGLSPAAPLSADAAELAQSNAARPAAPAGDPNDAQNLPYRFTGYKKFYDPDGYPAVAPPWGTLNAINLNTGDYLWKIPLGEYPALVAGPKEYWLRKLRRPDRHGWRRCIYRRHKLRQENPSLRQRYGGTVVGIDAPVFRQCYAGHVYGRRPPIRCNRRHWS